MAQYFSYIIVVIYEPLNYPVYKFNDLRNTQFCDLGVQIFTGTATAIRAGPVRRST